MSAARQRDVIDVNRRWEVWVGSRAQGYYHGEIRAPDYRQGRAAAGRRWPDIRIGFLVDADREDERVMAQVARVKGVAW